MKKVMLSSGEVAMVDDDKYNTLCKWKWRTDKDGYAIRDVWTGASSKRVFMHRIILNTPEGYCTDHINGNRLDNQKSNLRIATRQQNNFNRTVKRQNTQSKYKGVSKHRNKWRATITLDLKMYTIGIFENEFKAAKEYDCAAIALFGEFACPNFPVEKYALSDIERARARIEMLSSKTITSKYRGVSKYKRDGLYHACISVNEKTVHLGRFESEIDAARAYDKAALKIRNSKKKLNRFKFPELHETGELL